MPVPPESKKTNPLEFFVISEEPKECLEGEHCKNSPSNSTHPQCNDCRFSPGVPYFIHTHHWKPVKSKFKHRQIEEEKRRAKIAAAWERIEERKAKDPNRQARLAKAARAERRTNAEIIKATRNSGRVNRDGDHLLHDEIVLDTKLQSKAENPTVNLYELDKVRRDAVRNGKQAGGLVVRNKYGRGVIVFDERDIGKIHTS